MKSDRKMRSTRSGKSRHISRQTKRVSGKDRKKKKQVLQCQTKGFLSKVFVSNIRMQKKEMTPSGVELRHILCDCKLEQGGNVQKDVYRIFDENEYEGILKNGYYLVKLIPREVCI